jgi:hypothetical protein
LLLELNENIIHVGQGQSLYEATVARARVTVGMRGHALHHAMVLGGRVTRLDAVSWFMVKQILYFLYSFLFFVD